MAYCNFERPNKAIKHVHYKIPTMQESGSECVFDPRPKRWLHNYMKSSTHHLASIDLPECPIPSKGQLRGKFIKKLALTSCLLFVCISWYALV